MIAISGEIAVRNPVAYKVFVLFLLATYIADLPLDRGAYAILVKTACFGDII
jgi:hypothetical protein